MKIFLVYLAINSPQDTGYNYGLGYIAAMLKQKGRVVKYVSLKNNQDIESLYVKIKSERPAIIGFSATTSQFYYLSDIVKCIRTISDATIICGGTHPTLKPDCIFEIPELDGIVRGEGEFPMIDIAENIASGRDISNIANSWIRKKGEIIKNDLRPLIKNLNQLPFPDKDSLDYQKMLDQEKGINRFIFSRGCTFNCTYCSNKALRELYRDKGVYYRFESPERAIEEITNDASKFNFEKICLDDDTITLDKKWFYNFFDLYKKKVKYKFLCNIRPDNINEDMIKVLKDAGIERAVVGIEHGNEEFRRNVLKRNMTNAKIIDTFRLFNKYDIEYTGQIMVGLPFETKKLFLDTVSLCRKIRLKATNNISVFYPYPATDLGKICEKNNWMPKKKYYRERSDTIIDYPRFRGKKIRVCARVFPIFLRYKSMPLWLPFSFVRLFHKFMRFMKKQNLKEHKIFAY